MAKKKGKGYNGGKSMELHTGSGMKRNNLQELRSNASLEEMLEEALQDDLEELEDSNIETTNS